MHLPYLDSNGRVELDQLRKRLRRQATAENSLGVGLELIQDLFLLSRQQGPFQGLLEEPLKDTGLICFPAAAEAVIPEQLKGQGWV